MKKQSYRLSGILVATAVALLLSETAAHAQSQSLYGRQGPVTGQSNSLLSQSGRGSSGGRTASGSSLLGNQTGVGSMTGGTATTIRRGDFVGMSDDGSFVGMNPDAATSNRGGGQQNRNLRSGANRGANNRGANAGRGQGFNGGQYGNQNFNRQNRFGGNAQNQRPNVRPRQRVNFEFPEREVSTVVTSLRTQFAVHADRYPELANVTVLEQDGRIELFGEVETHDRRKVAEMIVRMEPGVRDVVNHMTVKSP